LTFLDRRSEREKKKERAKEQKDKERMWREIR
jgi:hypothetical protein